MSRGWPLTELCLFISLFYNSTYYKRIYIYIKYYNKYRLKTINIKVIAISRLYLYLQMRCLRVLQTALDILRPLDFIALQLFLHCFDQWILSCSARSSEIIHVD
ncbi:hypothetical protein PUN28_020036 [Cardiocondyla obscurior]|uniref:Uncharacterized protein n=1 Tax=Cardiocondyla obscurior TaxID=286306 RepID=A0AAW2EA66_9HYME